MFNTNLKLHPIYLGNLPEDSLALKVTNIFFPNYGVNEDGIFYKSNKSLWPFNCQLDLEKNEDSLIKLYNFLINDIFPTDLNIELSMSPNIYSIVFDGVLKLKEQKQETKIIPISRGEYSKETRDYFASLSDHIIKNIEDESKEE